CHSRSHASVLPRASEQPEEPRRGPASGAAQPVAAPRPLRSGLLGRVHSPGRLEAPINNPSSGGSIRTRTTENRKEESMQGDTHSDNDPQMKVTLEIGAQGSEAPEPGFPIEGGGGLVDDGGKVYTGPPPPQ